MKINIHINSITDRYFNRAVGIYNYSICQWGNNKDLL